MAELKIDMGAAVRSAMIQEIANIVDAMPTQRFAVIIELLLRDSNSRVMIAEAIGELGLQEYKKDLQHSDEDDYCEKSWDDIALTVLKQLKETPGGRGETL